MITLDQILSSYPENLRAFRESILKEYLQYKILNSIFDSEYANKLAFLGGTALRIVYGSTRFSEDLDFDNFALTEDEFIDLSKIIQKDLSLEGLEVEINTVTRNAYRIKIRIPKLLFDSGLSAMSEHKILIQVDTVPQNFDYDPEKPLLNKFDIFTQINAVPKDLLLAQKIFASVNRKRIMGRDFFDIVFLYGIGAKPDFAYLKKNIGVDNESDLKSYLLEKTASLNFEDFDKDVEHLLFDPMDKRKVLLFSDFVNDLNV
ncbi:nucleotidyl transferase AbiEii/AbiGii toxin family protein [Candidatus Peregrinibacteria bacterium]|nr:nucleotidyl transferase AbiEii/AbiGii toxin family protein [Candidatus Peregrinibacteria bacterium]